MTKASLWQAVVATLILLVPLGWMAGSNELALRTGSIHFIETGGVDPRDFLRGDYVEYRFPTFQGLDRTKFSNGDRVYALLTADDRGILTATSFVSERPPTGSLFVAGQYSRLGGRRLAVPAERFFVPEGTGRELEKLIRPYARVSVSSDGRMHILDIVPREEVLD